MKDPRNIKGTKTQDVPLEGTSAYDEFTLSVLFLLGGVFWLSSAVLFLNGVWLLGRQAYRFLQFGEWVSPSLATFIMNRFPLSETARWLADPQSWIGVANIAAWIPAWAGSWVLSLAVMVAGFICVFVCSSILDALEGWMKRWSKR